MQKGHYFMCWGQRTKFSVFQGLRDLSPSSRLPLKGVVRMVADQIEVLMAENVHLRSTLMQEQMDHSKAVEIITRDSSRLKELEELLNLKSEEV